MTSIARAMLEGRFDWEKDHQHQVTGTTHTTKKRKSSVKNSAAK